MFEVVANVLPPYHQIYTVCKRRIDSLQVDEEDERLTALMSYAYADLTRLCLDFYRIFFRNISGTHFELLVSYSIKAADPRSYLITAHDVQIKMLDRPTVMLTASRPCIASYDVQLNTFCAMAPIRFSLRTT
jgi:hypothetical protein